MHWIKEVEIAKSIDELVTSQSIMERSDFSEYDVPDAMIASALKKLLNTHVHIRKKVGVEEQRAQKYDRFFRGRQIAYMIHEHSCATGAFGAAQGVSVLYNVRLQNDDVQDFDVRWDQALISANEIPTEVVLEGFFTSQSDRILFNFRRSWLLHDQETVRNNGQPSYPRLKTPVKLHIDQTMRTRNFRVQSEVVERGAVTQSQKGKKAYVDRNVNNKPPTQENRYEKWLRRKQRLRQQL